MQKAGQRGFGHLLLLLIPLLVAVVGFAGWKVYIQQQNSKNNNNTSGNTNGAEFVYERHQPKTIKGVLDPGVTDAKALVTDSFSDLEKLGTNTFYVYVDYSYNNGQLQLTTEGVADNQSQAEQKYIELIKLAKQKGLAVHVALSFSGGQNSSFGVPIEQFMADIEPFDIKWAEVAQQYKAETFAPSSEVDWQMFREYYQAKWDDQAGFDNAINKSNEYHARVLPKLREVFSGKIIYQAGLWSDKLGSVGYDIYGTGLNTSGAELKDFRDLAKKVYGYAQTNANRQGGGWMVTEFWAPIYEQGPPGKTYPALKTPSGTPYPEIQDQFYKIAIEEYQNWQGPLKPLGFSFTTYLGQHSKIKDRPAEALINEFYKSLP